jgi:hypothetical protein
MLNNKILKIECEALNWKNPKYSFSILGIMNLYFLLTFFTDMNFITIVSYLFLFYVVSGIAVSKFIEKQEKEYKDILIYNNIDQLMRNMSIFQKTRSNHQLNGYIV